MNIRTIKNTNIQIETIKIYKNNRTNNIFSLDLIFRNELSRISNACLII